MNKSPSPRKWLGITFTCCKTYGRAYRNDLKMQYVAMCPKCGRQLVFKIGQGGMDSRFFEVE